MLVSNMAESKRYVPPGLRARNVDGEVAGLQRRLEDVVLQSTRRSEQKPSGYNRNRRELTNGLSRQQQGAHGNSGRRRTAEEEAARIREREMTLDWKIYDTTGPLSLDEFLLENSTSRLDFDNLASVVVSKSKGAHISQDDANAVSLAWNELIASGEEITREAIDVIARSTGCTRGNWIITLKQPDVDRVWNRIAKAVVEGQLGPCAALLKLESPRERDTYLCKVKTDNYLDENDVFRVLDKLKELEIPSKAAYKPVVFSQVGIYSNNSLGFRPSIYNVELSNQPAGHVRESGQQPSRNPEIWGPKVPATEKPRWR